jgi:hypothetical protein
MMQGTGSPAATGGEVPVPDQQTHQAIDNQYTWDRYPPA